MPNVNKKFVTCIPRIPSAPCNAAISSRANGAQPHAAKDQRFQNEQSRPEVTGLSLPSSPSLHLPPFHSAGADGGGPVSITVRPEPHRRTAPPRRANYAISPGPTPSDHRTPVTSAPSDHRTSVTSAGGLPQASPDSRLSHIPTSSSAISSPRLRLNAVSASLQTAVPISTSGRLHLPTFSDESPHLFPRGPL